ncbi:YibE/F family protein [bacterium]|nr:YibE/F family protein [bacterium]
MRSHRRIVQNLLVVIIFAFCFLLPFATGVLAQTESKADQSTNRDTTIFAGSGLEEQLVVGKVLEATKLRVNKELLGSTGMISNLQTVKLRITEGALSGKEFIIDNELTDNPAYNVEVEPGQEVVVALDQKPDGTIEINIADYNRTPVLAWLLVAFLAAFLVFGGKQGVKSLLALLITVLLVACVLLPLSLQGFNPLMVSVFICLAATATSILLIGGFTKKSLAAIMGTIGGVIVAGIAAQLVIWYAPLTGLSSEEAQILRGSVLVQKPPFYSGLLAAGMLIGALGVIMDVGISIASAVSEISKADAKMTMKELYDSGMNVGRDIMGTMTNTLILAYTGGALPLLLLATQMPSIKLVNLDLFATEVASALSGSLGLVFTIPLTAIVAARVMSPKD